MLIHNYLLYLLNLNETYTKKIICALPKLIIFKTIDIENSIES